MIQVFCARRGSGKTKRLIELANHQQMNAKGDAVYIDDDSRPMLQLARGIRFVDTNEYRVEDIRDRVAAEVSPLLMKWIGREGKDIFNLQENSEAIANGIREDLDMQMIKDGITVTDFKIQSFSYPDNVWDKINVGK